MPVVIISLPPSPSLGQQKAVLVGSTPTVVVDYQPGREGFHVVNSGPSKAYWGFNMSVIPPVAGGPNQGTPLEVGDTITTADIPGYNGDIYVVVGGADPPTVLSVVEWA